MNIQEAVKKVLKIDGVIYRKSVRPEGEATYGAIKPTNSYDSCRLLVFKRGVLQRSCRDWSPTADDLIADDWEIEL